MFTSFLRATVFFLLLVGLGVEAYASVISRTRTVTAQHSYFEDVDEIILVEESSNFVGIGQTTVEVEADRAAFIDVDYSGPARAQATIKATDLGAPEPYINSVAYVTGQLIATPLHDSTHVLRSIVEEVAVGVAPVGDGIRVLYSFDLKNMSIELWDNRPSGSGGVLLDAGISYLVELNGQPKYEANAHLLSFGRLENLRVFQHETDGIDFMGRPVSGTLDVRPETTGPGDVPRRIEFDDKSVHFLDLGVAPPGETYEVKPTMVAELYPPRSDFEFGGRVNIGDPNDLSGIGFGQITEISVPEPAATWLLLGGLGVLAAFHGAHRKLPRGDAVS